MRLTGCEDFMVNARKVLKTVSGIRYPSLVLFFRLQSGRPGFDPWIGKIPWRRERLPTAVFWPGKFHGLHSPWGCKESDTTEQLSLHFWKANMKPGSVHVGSWKGHLMIGTLDFFAYKMGMSVSQVSLPLVRWRSWSWRAAAEMRGVQPPPPFFQEDSTPGSPESLAGDAEWVQTACCLGRVGGPADSGRSAEILFSN